jgi:formamidopyrimidine-DNA glycosylase
MPELPDIELYLGALRPRVTGHRLEGLRIGNPFVLRSIEPRPDEVAGRHVAGLRRIGKRVVFELDGEIFIIVHLMIAGRFRWRPPATRLPGRVGLAAFDFPVGTLLLTEASPKKRASIHLARGEAALRVHDPGGLEVLEADAETFDRALRRESHTLKRALTDPRLFSGVGNAYSDEILHAARLSPLALTSRISSEESRRLHRAAQDVLRGWIARLLEQHTDAFPEKVTAFRPGMAVHGRYGQPCPACGSTVQRLVYAQNEANYCATCQTGGRLLADRALSRLLRSDWPRTPEEMEEHKASRRPPEA